MRLTCEVVRILNLEYLAAFSSVKSPESSIVEELGSLTRLLKEITKRGVHSAGCVFMCHVGETLEEVSFIFRVRYGTCLESFPMHVNQSVWPLS